MSQPAALVLDGDLKQSLAIVRSLGKAGVSVCVGAERRTGMALGSRFTRGSFTYPSPQSDPTGFVATVRTEVARLREKTGVPVVLYTASDATAQQIAAHQDDLKELAQLILPSSESFAIAFDKAKTLTLAAQLGVPTMPELNYADRDSFSYPVVLKPRQSTTWRAETVTSGTAEFIFTAAELTKRYEEIEVATALAPLIQPLVRGGEYGVEMLCEQETVVQSFAHERIRSLSPRGGAAVVKATAPDTERTKTMYAYAEKLVTELAWSGPIMVEFKYDREADLVRLMEINGRWWGSLPLPQAAGVDFAYGYYALATGTPVPEASLPAPACRTYHFWGDVKWLLTVLFAKDPMRSLLYPRRMEALVDFGLEILRGRSDVFWFTDPMPSYFELIDILKR